MNEHIEPPLTERQQQILKLLQAGKVNKEIARELGIGVGTVKQHTVALFKRLHVKNRTMAAAKGGELARGEGSHPVFVSDGILERRPIIAMSLALPEGTENERTRRFFGILEKRAAECDALFVARKDQGADIVFGVSHVAEDDVLRALRLAHLAFSELSAQDAPLAARLRGGVAAGLAVISMGRHGGWSGEAIASESIAHARDLQRLVPQGHMMLGQTTLDLIRSMGIGERRGLSPAMTFPQVAGLQWTGERGDNALLGRESEMKALSDLLIAAGHGEGHVLALTGEIGMGKTRLAREIFKVAMASGGMARFFRGQPESAGGGILDISDPSQVAVVHGQPVEGLLRVLQMRPIRKPEVVIIDDLHWLPEETRQRICIAAVAGAQAGKLIVLVSRHPACTELIERKSALSLHLVRLPKTAITNLLQTMTDSATSLGENIRASDLRTLITLASGVPMFALELGRAATQGSGSGVTLALLTIVCARLDMLRLDHKMLRAIAQAPNGLTVSELAQSIGEDEESLSNQQDVGRLLASGVITKNTTGERLVFTHPLVRQVVEQLNLG
ncbi:MAG: LuxR C-terminal-related transcriptional regulator [Rhodocyclaceae bacterium]|nr:LuxR C-terminal-related transcriptional regulator [Rhodocyclaceae bacterium]